MGLLDKKNNQENTVDSIEKVAQMKATTKIEIRKISNQVDKLRKIKETLIKICADAKNRKDAVIYKFASEALKLAVKNINMAEAFIPQAENMLAVATQQENGNFKQIFDNLGRRLQNVFNQQSVFVDLESKLQQFQSASEEYLNTMDTVLNTGDAVTAFESDPEIDALIDNADKSDDVQTHEAGVAGNASPEKHSAELKKLAGMN